MPTARQPAEEVAPAIEVLLGESVRLRFPPSTAPSLIVELVTVGSR